MKIVKPIDRFQIAQQMSSLEKMPFVRIGCCILGKSQPRVKDYTLGWNFQQFFYIDIC